MFETASPFDTPRLMDELVAWVTQERDKAQLHPLLIIAIFVVVFLEIHPFQDGNGRLRRVLTTLLLIQAGYAYVSYSSLESVIELSLQIVEFAREHGRITIGDAIKLTGISRNTLKQHFRNLVERRHLNQQGSGHGVWHELA